MNELEALIPAYSRLRRLVNEEADEIAKCAMQGCMCTLMAEPGSLTVAAPIAPGLEDLRALLSLLRQAKEKLISLPRLVGDQEEEEAFARMGEHLQTACQAVDYSAHMVETYGLDRPDLGPAIAFRAEQNYLLGVATLRQAEFFGQEGNEAPPKGWEGYPREWASARWRNRVTWAFYDCT